MSLPPIATLVESLPKPLTNNVVVTIRDANYHSTRTIWNGMIDRFPAIIIQPRGEADIQATVKWCTKHSVQMTIKGGGHNVAGISIADGTILLNLSANMKHVTVDSERRVCKVAGGALWQDVDRECSIFSLATPAGLISHTGVGGLALGGGVGWLSRKYGLACDNILSATVVLASGDCVTASKDQNSDLYWAIRGGGGNFGVVSSFTLQLHPLAKSPFVGSFQFNLANSLPVTSNPINKLLSVHNDFCNTQSTSVTSYAFITATCCTFYVVQIFDPQHPTKWSRAEFVKICSPYISVRPAESSISQMPYNELNQLFDIGNAHGKQYYWSKSTFFKNDLPPSVGLTITENLQQIDGAVTVEIVQWGGAIKDETTGSTAFNHRAANFEVHAIASWSHKDDKKLLQVRKWMKLFSQQMSSYANSVGSNMNTDNIFDNKVHQSAVYGNAYPRLQQIKLKYDPSNFFKFNHNIIPNTTTQQYKTYNTDVSASSLTQNVEAIHKYIGCDLCGMLPIVGVRYKCGTCDDFDLCEKCESRLTSAQHSSSHYFIKIRVPTTLPLKVASQRKLPNTKRLPASSTTKRPSNTNLLAQLKQPPQLKKVPTAEQRDFSTPAYNKPSLYLPDGTIISSNSVQEAFVNVCEQFKHSPALGTIINNDSWQYKYLSYGEFGDRTKAFSMALAKLHISTATVGVIYDNIAECIIADFACMLQGITCIPLPSEQPIEILDDLMCEAKVSVLITDACHYQKLANLQICRPEMIVIQRDHHGKEGVLTFDQLIRDNLSSIDTFKFIVPKPDSLQTLMYTSGSSGTPKGVERTVKQWYQLMATFLSPQVGESLSPYITMSYAPMSHFMERTSVWTSLLKGAQIALFNDDPSNLVNAIQSAEPTILTAPPIFWNSIYSIYKQRVQSCKDMVNAEEIALSQMRGYLGSRLAIIVTGGAQTSHHIIQFLRKCFKCTVSDGYGSTETGPILADGKVLPGVEVRLVDVPTMNYFSSDKPNPRGEIWVRTNNIARGYYKNRLATSAAFKPNGWYATGDIGEHDMKTDTISIIDRMKNFFKLSSGEFVAPESIEKKLVTCKSVLQLLVTSSPSNSFLVAIVVLDQTAATSTSDGDQVKQAILQEMRSCASKLNLQQFEIPKAVVLELHHPWTVENGKLTSTLKLQRAAIKAFYRSKIVVACDKLQSKESQVATILSSILNSTVECDATAKFSFKNIGGNSLAALEFITTVREQFGCNLSLKDLYSFTSLKELVNFIRANDSSTSQQHLQAYEQARLDMNCGLNVNTFKLAESTASSNIGIFLTGATGFLGAHLLNSLLLDSSKFKPYSSCDIFCLVRCKNANHGLTRIQQAAEEYQLPAVQQELRNERCRISVICGTLDKPLFGLPLAEFVQLANNISTIFHNGALVNWLCSYETAKVVNVVGTQTVLQLAATTASSFKSVHLVSTISVATTPFEHDKLDMQVLKSFCQQKAGYGASKWVSEYLVTSAFEQHNIPITIHRPAMITAHTKSGACNPSDFVSRLLKAFVELQYAIKSNTILDMTPVDYVASSIVAISLHAATTLDAQFVGKRYHYANNCSFTYSKISAVVQSYNGATIASIEEYNKWRAILLKNINNSKENSLAPLVSYFPKGQLLTIGSFDDSAVSKALTCINENYNAQYDVKCPAICESYIHTALSFLLK